MRSLKRMKPLNIPKPGRCHYYNLLRNWFTVLNSWFGLLLPNEYARVDESVNAVQQKVEQAMNSFRVLILKNT